MRALNTIRTGRLTAVVAGVAALSVAGAVAYGQGEAPADEGPPKLTSLKMAKVVTSQRGHARFLVGIKTSEAAKLTIILSSNRDGEPVRTISDDDARPAGRAYSLVEAVDDRGFQLPAGSYKVRIQATSEDNEVSQPVSGDFTLRLTRARGQLDALTIPTWTSVAKPLGIPVGSGQLVAAVKPKGQAVLAGLRRGDVITKLGGTATPTAGALQVALRQTPADRPVRVEYTRKGEQRLGVIKPKPDWTAAPNWSRILEVARRRDPKVLAWGVAQVRERIDAGELEEADELLDAWPRGWKATAPGQLLRGDVLQGQDESLKALAAHSRARKRDRTMAQAWFGRGIALAGLKKPERAAVEFSRAARLDPGDPAAPAFRSYVLSRAERTDDAVTAATAAVALDRRYADAHIPLGIALLAKGDRARGLKALRTGLLLLDEQERAAPLIAEHLDPADP